MSEESREEIEIKKRDDGKYVIVKTNTDVVTPELIEKFHGEISQGLEETKKNLEAIPAQIKERTEALITQRDILAKRLLAFEPHAKAIADEKLKSAEIKPAETDAHPTTAA